MTREEFFTQLENGARWDIGVAINRTNPVPIDANSVFEDENSLLTYVQTNPLAYPGQIVSVISTSEVAAYIINITGQSGTYSKLAASSASGDIGQDVETLKTQVANIQTAIYQNGQSGELKVATTSSDGFMSSEDKTLLDQLDTDVTQLKSQVSGLTGAMHFVGTSTTDPTLEAGPTIADHSGEYVSGDVCLYDGKEYIYDGTTWQEFGNEGDHLTEDQANALYVPLTRTVNEKALSSNITLTAADVGADATGTAQNLISQITASITNSNTAQTIATLTQTNGVVSATFQNIQINQSQVTDLVTNLQGKQDLLTFDGKYNSDTNKVATQSTITAAIAALDTADEAVSGQYVSAVSQVDGIISVTRATLPEALTYSAGAGLNLSGSEFSIANNGVITTMIADNAVTDTKISEMNVSKLIQTSGDWLVLSGGNAASFATE